MALSKISMDEWIDVENGMVRGRLRIKRRANGRFMPSPQVERERRESEDKKRKAAQFAASLAKLQEKWSA